MAKRRKNDGTWIVRAATQFAFVAYVFFAAVRHGASEVESGSLHALCPFGAVESLWSLVAGGKFLPKLHASSLVLSVGLFAGALLVGGAFCGWICPLGALGDLLSWVRRKLHIREVVVPARLDGILRYGRYVVLAVIMIATISTATLWFAAYDPYYVLFRLGPIFEFNLAADWPGYLIALGVVAGSLFIPRVWCRYLCPLGGLLSLVQRISPFKVRRDAQTCIDCRRCDKVCPARLSVSTARAVTHDCTMCLRCTSECPVPGALDAALPALPGKPAQPAVAKPQEI